jgi:RNA polymerase sigma-70 factor (ECF subfamily)
VNGVPAEAPMAEEADNRSSEPNGEDVLRQPQGKLFLRLFLENERRLYAYILTLLANHTDAEDVLQEASLVMWDKFDEQCPPDNFIAWACRIAYFKVLDFTKKSQRSRVRFSEAMLKRVSESMVEQASSLELDERREALAQCIERLAPKHRDLLARRLAHGATTQSTAVQVGRSVDAVYKARSKIRQALFDCVNRAMALQRIP